MERPDFRLMNFKWPGIGKAREHRWVGVTPGYTGIPYQIGETCTHHALTTTSAANYTIQYHRRNMPIPFDSLSVQFAVDRSEKSVSPSNSSAKIRAFDVFQNEGILAVEHYSGHGKRGEILWKPPHQLPNNHHRYKVTFTKISSPYLESSFKRVRYELARGPLFASFSFRVKEYEKVGRTVAPHDGVLLHRDEIDNDVFSSHSVCLFGFGLFRSRFTNKVEPYYIYRNTYGEEWGDRGWGRIKCKYVSSIYAVRVPESVPELNILSCPQTNVDTPTINPPSPFTDCFRFTNVSQAKSSSSRGSSSHTRASDVKRKREMNTVCPRNDAKSDELLFSATFNDSVRQFVSKSLEELVVRGYNQKIVEKEEFSLNLVKQYQVSYQDELSENLMIKHKVFELGQKIGQTVIFLQSRNSASMLHHTPVDFGYEVMIIQGDLKLDDRDKIVKGFKDRLTQALISTDLLAQGFDDAQVNLVMKCDLVMKYDTPNEQDAELYLHRIGRAGGFGCKSALFNMIVEKIEKQFESHAAEVLWFSTTFVRGYNQMFVNKEELSLYSVRQYEVSGLDEILKILVVIDKPFGLDEKIGQTIIFGLSRKSASMLYHALFDFDHEVMIIQGGLNQDDRDKVVKKFKDGLTQFLISTDLARDFDHAQVNLVLNFDILVRGRYNTHNETDTKACFHQIGAMFNLCGVGDLMIIEKIEKYFDSQAAEYDVSCLDEFSEILLIKDILFELGQKIGQSIMFVASRNSASMFSHEIMSIQGGLKQEKRDKIVKESNDGLTRALFSTDLHAQGFDQVQVNWVVNFDCPVRYRNPYDLDTEVNLHYMGRAGWFGGKVNPWNSFMLLFLAIMVYLGSTGAAEFQLLCSGGDLMIMEKVEKYFDSQADELLLFSATFVRVYYQMFVKEEELSLNSARHYEVACLDEIPKNLVIKKLFELGQKIGQTIIFVSSRKSTSMLLHPLVDFGQELMTIQGALCQYDREKVVKEFKERLTEALISIDLLARGIDGAQADMVLNFDILVRERYDTPNESDTEVYFRQMGKAGQCAKGAMRNLLCSDGDLMIMEEIDKHFDSQAAEVFLFSATFLRGYKQMYVKIEELSLKSMIKYELSCPYELSKILVIKDRLLELGQEIGQTTTFVQSRNSASMLHHSIVDFGHKVMTLQCALNQEDRGKIVKKCKDGLTQVLISTHLLDRVFDQSQVNVIF